MNKVVYNACSGGFRLITKAIEMYTKRKGLKPLKRKKSFGDYSYCTDESLSGESFYYQTYVHHDPDLMAVVKELGSQGASGMPAKLRVHQLIRNRYMIEEYEEYDGYKAVTEDLDGHWTYINETT